MFKSFFNKKTKSTKSTVSNLDKLKSLLLHDISEYPRNDRVALLFNRDDFSKSIEYMVRDIAENYEIIKLLYDNSHIDEDFVDQLIISLEEDNEPYVSLAYPDFESFISGLKEHGFNKWLMNKNGSCIGLSKTEILDFRGVPTSIESKADSDGTVETLVYGNSKSHGTYFGLKNDIVIQQTIRD